MSRRSISDLRTKFRSDPSRIITIRVAVSIRGFISVLAEAAVACWEIAGLPAITTVANWVITRYTVTAAWMISRLTFPSRIIAGRIAVLNLRIFPGTSASPPHINRRVPGVAICISRSLPDWGASIPSLRLLRSYKHRRQSPCTHREESPSLHPVVIRFRFLVRVDFTAASATEFLHQGR